MSKWLEKLKWVQKFPVWTTLLLVVWLLFFDTNNWRSMIITWYNLRLAKNEKAYYQQQTEAVKKEHDEVMGTPKQLEKFARERYLMKKPTEELFVVEQPKKAED